MEFITEWNMPVGNFTLPLRVGFTYNMVVDWGDGTPTSTVTAYNATEATHNYAEAGIYQISITGTCEAWYINNIAATRLKLLKVIAWGNVGFTTTGMEAAFKGCSNLTDLPAGSITGANGVTRFKETFYNCTKLNAIPAGLFDNNTLVAASGFNSTFYNCAALTSIPAGLFDNNTLVSTSGFFSTFYGCDALTSIPAGLFDNNTLVSTSGFYGTFYGCDVLTSIPAGLFDNNTLVSTSGFYLTFSGCDELTSIPAGLFDNNTAVSAQGFRATFYNCVNLTSIPAGLFDYNIAVSTSGFYQTFYNCNKITSIPAGLFANNTLVSTSGFYGTFYNCAALTSIPAGLFDNNTLVSTSGFYQTFAGCTNLTTIPAGLFDYNTAVSTSGFRETFRSCSNLTSIPVGLFDNNTVVGAFGFYRTFFGCTSLTTVPAGLFDNNTLVAASGFYQTFQQCTNLETVPSGLFRNNVNVTTTGFYQTFLDCNKLQLNKYIFYNEGEQTTRFLNRVSNFQGCFSRASFTGVKGEAPDLWNCDFGTQTPVITTCYSGLGNSFDSLSNYCYIPTTYGSVACPNLQPLNIVNRGNNLIEIQIFSSIVVPAEDEIRCYLAETNVALASPENLIVLSSINDIVFTGTKELYDGCPYYILVEYYTNGILTQSLNASGIFCTITQINTTTINIVAENRLIPTYRHSNNHGLLYYNGYIFGSARGDGIAQANDQSIIKINANDYTDYQQIKIFLNKNLSTNPLYQLEQIVYCRGFLWALSSGRLIRINPDTLDYIVFSAIDTTTFYQPIGTDGLFLYLTTNLAVYKIDCLQLLDDGSVYSYTGDNSVPIPAPAILGNCLLVQYHETYRAYTHSIQIDNRYIYLANTVSTLTNGYDSVTETYIFNFQKIDKNTMQTAGSVVIPKCTDDMVQNDRYVFLAPEYNDDTIPLYGDSWGLIAIRKSDLTVRYLKALHSDFLNGNNSVRMAHGVQYFGQYICVQLVDSKKTIVINTNDVDLWGENYPIGGATTAVYSFTMLGSAIANPANELVVSPDGYYHANLWFTATTFFKWQDPNLIMSFPPVVQSVLIQSLIDSTTIGGTILQEGSSAVTEVGLRYGIASNNLDQIISFDDPAINFQSVLNLAPGIYYFQAYAANSVGTSYGAIVPFVVGNTVILSHDSAGATASLRNNNCGHAVRFCKRAWGVADGTIGSATDADGNTYKTVVINEIEWAAADLKTALYNNEDVIPEIQDNTAWSTTISGARAGYNNVLPE